MQQAVNSKAPSVLAASAQRPVQTPGSTAQALAGKYDLLGRIGEGTYGVVYLATSKDGDKRLYAIKTFKTGREGDGISPTAVREIMLLRDLRHEHIVRLDSVHINRSEPSLSLAFDYAEHDLYEMIRHHRDRTQTPMHPYVVKSMMWQLLNGLTYLHQNWIIHRDLKPSNVLVMGDGPEQGRVKIGDFGLARFFQAPLRPLSDNGVVVTIWYRAPELLLGARHYTRAVDVWAVGTIFAELLLLRPLFQGAERKQAGAPFQADQLDRIFRVLGHPSARAWPHLEHLHHWHDNTDNVRVKRPEWSANRLGEHLADVCRQMGEMFRNPAAGMAARPSAAAVDLMQRMLEYDPQQRISAADALRHEYFNEEPRAGANAFVMPGGGVMAHYPRRSKHSVLIENGAAAASAATGTGHAAASGRLPAQPQVQPPPQQRAEGAPAPAAPARAPTVLAGPLAAGSVGRKRKGTEGGSSYGNYKR